MSQWVFLLCMRPFVQVVMYILTCQAKEKTKMVGKAMTQLTIHMVGHEEDDNRQYRSTIRQCPLDHQLDKWSITRVPRCRRQILSGLLCFSFIWASDPFCSEVRTWASNLVLSLLFINFIESLSHFVLNLYFVWFSCLIVNYVVSHLIVLCFKYRFVNVLYRFVSCHFYFVKCHLILINRVF